MTNEDRAKLFRDREHPGDWRVEKFRDDGESIDVALFSGSEARARAIRYAEREYGGFEKIELHPYNRLSLGEILGDLSRSAIPVSIDTLVDGSGYVFRLGTSGDIEGAAESVYDLALSLRDYAIENFPDSQFAEQYRVRRGFE